LTIRDEKEKKMEDFKKEYGLDAVCVVLDNGTYRIWREGFTDEQIHSAFKTGIYSLECRRVVAILR